jgi:putative acetyltransferase
VPPGRISTDDPRADDVRRLLERHLAHARATTAPDDVHALDVDGLVDPAVMFFSHRVDGELLGVAALKRLDDRHAEIKSMHTAEAARGRGIGRAMVDHLVAVARERGYRRVSLETGAGPAFAPARGLYARAGFTPCGAFAPYRPSPNSAYMTLCLERPRQSSGASAGRAHHGRGANPRVPVFAELRLIRAAIAAARDDPSPRRPGGFHVDGVFHLDFEPADGSPDSWTCGLYEEIDVAPGPPGLEAQLDGMARSAADDVVHDLRMAGYEPSGDTAALPIAWTFAPGVVARAAGGGRPDDG